MKLSAQLRLCLTVTLLFAATSALHAQLPKNSEVWKLRCNLFAANAASIDSGKTPPVLAASTRGVPGKYFYTFGVDRSEANEHFVACTMYYLAAVSERAGNGGKADPAQAATDSVLAATELKLALGQSLTMSERLKRSSQKLSGSTLTLNADQAKQTLAAATTVPLTLTPPPPTPQKH